MVTADLTVFLSYARGDDEPFARRLYDDLTAAGFDVWFDRVDMPSRQLTFHQEIKDAIRSRERLITVVGPEATVSDYVREEWLLALALDKPVIPILRMGSFDLIPGNLSLFHCADFRDDADYPTQLDALIASLRRPPPKTADLHAVPELPQHFVARPELMHAVKSALLKDLQAPVVVTGAASRIGVKGMGGIGKSLLAAAVARDPEVRRAYPDGVVWLFLGPDPDVTRLQRRLTRAFGEDSAFESEEEGRGALRRVLRDRAALLVLDDVWDAAHVKALGELGPRSRALVTTRDAGVLRALEVELFQVQLLTKAESVRLFSEAVGVDTASLPPAAHEVIDECGRLPLALALCAGMARGEHGVPWASIRDALRAAQLEEISDEQAASGQHENLWKAIKVSVDMLEPDDRERWIELSVFGGDKSVPASAVMVLWHGSGALGALGCEKLLKRLWERSLIDLASEESPNTESRDRRVSMHDLLHDYAKRTAGDDTHLHRRFTDAAWAVYTDRPADFQGYVRDHLPRHLVQAKEPHRLLRLLADRELDYFHLWAEQGMAAEGIRCLEFLVEELTSRGESNLVRSLATQLARLCNRLGRESAAESWLTVALGGYREGEEAGRAEIVAFHELGSLALSRGDYARAKRAYREALRLARGSSPPLPREVAANLIGLAVVAYLRRLRPDRTVRLARLALRAAEEAQDAPHMAEACRILTDAYKDDLQHAEAEGYLVRGLAIAEEDGLTAARLSLLTAKAWMLWQRCELGEGQPEVAEAAFKELLRHARRANDWRFEAEAWAGVGTMAVVNGHAEPLEEAIGRLKMICDGRSRPHLEARLGLLEGARLERAGRFTEAARSYAETAEFSRASGLWSRQAGALIAQGAAWQQGGQEGKARRCRRQAEEILKRCPRATQAIGNRKLQALRADDREETSLPH